jgi:hypothetical protein
VKHHPGHQHALVILLQIHDVAFTPIGAEVEANRISGPFGEGCEPTVFRRGLLGRRVHIV